MAQTQLHWLAFSLFSLSVCFLELSTAAADVNETFIRETCKKTDNFQLCVMLIESDGRTELKSSFQGFYEIIAGDAVTMANVNRAHVGNLYNKASDNGTKKCLSTCSHWYSDSIFFLQDSIKEMKSKNYWEMRESYARGIQGSRVCQEADPGVCKPLVTSMNERFDELCGIAGAILNLIDAVHKPPKS